MPGLPPHHRQVPQEKRVLLMPGVPLHKNGVITKIPVLEESLAQAPRVAYGPPPAVNDPVGSIRVKPPKPVVRRKRGPHCEPIRRSHVACSWCGGMLKEGEVRIHESCVDIEARVKDGKA